MKAVFHVAIFLAYLWPVTASANWQYTKWGMTAKQVEVASKHVATEAGPSESADNSARDGSEVVKLIAPYQTGAFKFKAYFGFGPNDKLTGIKLKLMGGDPHELVGALRNKYGEPQNENTQDPIMRTWLWIAGDDKIQAIMIGDDLTVSYGPTHGAKEKGL